MKPHILLLLLLMKASLTFSQLSGLVSVPGTYTSITSVVSALNQQGVSGALTVAVVSGYTETAPSGGYSLTATGTSVNPIVFIKNGVGANPLIMAYSGGSGTPGSMNQDGVWRLIGSDYITIDGIDILDTNASNPETMEFGYGLFKADGSNGCQHNTIKNCTITLKRLNNSAGAGPASDGSRGIDVVNATSNVHNSVITVSATSGSHSYNKFYANTIQNCNVGISLIGFADTSPFSYVDVGNDVGGSASLTGNAVLDFGGGGVTNAALGIRAQAQYDLNVSYNIINNNTGVGLDHAATLRGIYLFNAASANATIGNNTLTLHAGGTNAQVSAIENASGSAAANNTITITNNLISNCSYNTATSGSFYGIWNSASPSCLTIASNTLMNNSTGANSGSNYLIYNNGAVVNQVNISDNRLSFNFLGSQAYTGTLYSIYNANGTNVTNLILNNNTFSNYNYLNNTGSGNLYFIINTNDSYSVSINGNTWNNLSLNHSGPEYLIHNNTGTQSFLAVNNNSILTSYTRLGSAGVTYLYYSNGASPSNCTQVMSGNNFSHITAGISGTGLFYGIYNTDGSGAPYPKKAIVNNVLSDITINSSGAFYGFYLDNLGDASSASGSSVSGNTITSVNRQGALYGLYIAGISSPTLPVQIYSNSISYLNTSGSLAYAAYLGGGSGGISFYKNKISDVTCTSTAGVVNGVYITGAVNTNLQNNCIGNLYTPNSSATNALNGIYINSGTFVAAYYNTVFLNGTALSGIYNSNALFASTTTSLALRNNIFVNTSSGGTGVSAAFRRSSTNLSTYSSVSNTNLFYAGVPGPNNVLLQSGATAYQSLSNLQTAVSPRDAQSISVLPSFMSSLSTSQNYLHITPNVASPIESAGVNLSGISDDYDAQIRQGNSGYTGSGSAPDLGADEFNQNVTPCSSASAGSISPLSFSICAGQTISLIANGYTPGTGLQHQWKFSTTSGGTYSNVIGGIGSNTPEYMSSGLSAGTYYFIMATTCTNNALSASSNEATVVVNAIPSVTASAQNTLLCAGQAINLTANSSAGALYSWSGPSGFNSNIQSPTLASASSSASGIYSVSATVNNCSSLPAFVTISVSQVTLNLSASQQTLCLGTTATLSLNTSAGSYTWSNGSNSNSISISPTINTTYSVLVTNTANCSLMGSLMLKVINPTITVTNTVVCGNSAGVTLTVNAFNSSFVNWYPNVTSTLSIHTGNTYGLAVSTTTTFYVEATHSLINCVSPRLPVTVTVSAYPVLSLSANPYTVCPGKTSTLSATGANSYSWSGVGSGSLAAVSPTAGQTFTVRGTNTLGCSSYSTISVNTYTSALVSITPSLASVCPSSVLGFTASGAVSYTWNTGTVGPINTVTPAVNSTYTVYGSNAQGCVSSKTIAVTTKSVPVITIIQSIDSICPGEPVNFKAFGASTYSWLPGFISGSTFTAYPIVTAVFNVIGKSVNTCTSIAFSGVFVRPCTGLFEEGEGQEVRIFPNPAKKLITVEVNWNGVKELVLQNSLGLELSKKEFSTDPIELDLSDYSPGVYFLQIKYNQKFSRHKFIKE